MLKSNFLWIVLSIFLLANFSCTKSTSRPESHPEPEGFADIKWRQDISTLEGMVCVKNKHPQQKVYTKKDDDFKMGKANLDRVEYYFWDDKFYSAIVTIKGYENFKRLKKAVFNEFGKGKEEEVRDGFGYSWKNDKTTINLGYLKDYQKGTLSIELKDVARQARKQIMKDFLK